MFHIIFSNLFIDYFMNLAITLRPSSSSVSFFSIFSFLLADLYKFWWIKRFFLFFSSLFHIFIIKNGNLYFFTVRYAQKILNLFICHKKKSLIRDKIRWFVKKTCVTVTFFFPFLIFTLWIEKNSRHLKSASGKNSLVAWEIKKTIFNFQCVMHMLY